MATFVPISYTYVSTAPRFKSTATRNKPASKQSSILNKLQHSKLSQAAALSMARQAAADDSRRDKLEIRETGTVYDGNDDDDDCNLPSIEQLLYTTLQKEGFATEDYRPKNTAFKVEDTIVKKGGSLDHNYGSAPNDNSGCSLKDPIVLLGGDDSSASGAEVDDVSLCAESVAADENLLDSPETAVDSTTPAPSNLDGWHNIDDFLETPRLQLAEQKPSTSNPTRPRTCFSSRASSEPWNDHISAADHCTVRARSEAIMSHPACSRSQSPDHHPTDRSAADEHELVCPALNPDIFEEDREQQEDDGNDNEDGKQLQHEVKEDVAAALMTGKISDTHLLSKKDESLELANRDLSPKANEEKSESNSYTDDKLNSNLKSDEDDKKPSFTKRKRPSLSINGPTQKKHKHHLEQRSIYQHRPHPKSHRHYSKSHTPPDQSLRVAVRSSEKDRLSSPAPSTPQATDIEMPSDCTDLGGSSRNILPRLIEVTFCPQSLHCCSFTAVIQDGCNRRGVSFSQVARLIESTGHVGKIDDFTIKPIKQHSFLVTGFSRPASPRLSSSGKTVSTAAEASSILDNTPSTVLQHGRAVDTRTIIQQGSESASSDDDSDLSDDDECSSEDEQKCSSTSKHSRWSDLDEQRLVAYKKEDKSWEWIFKKFSGRTPAAVRTRWTMVQHRVN